MGLFDNKDKIFAELMDKKDKQLAQANKLLIENQQAFKNSSSKNYAGGIPNQAYNSGDLGVSFGFPKNFAETVKIMDNTSIPREILDYYTSLITAYDWTISYKDDDLNKDIAHKELSDFVMTQFECIGGIRSFINTSIRQFMKYGFVIMTPILKLKKHKFSFQDESKLIPYIESFKFWDPIGVYRFYSEENDNQKCAGVQYLSMPRLVIDENGNESTTNSQMINITNENSLMGFASLDNEGGDFMGTSILKDIYGEWRVLNNLTSTVNQQLITFGEHSYQFVPHAGIDYAQINMETIQIEISLLLDNGGGVYYSQYGTLQKIESMDLTKYVTYQSELSREISSRKGLGIDALSQSSGASRNLAEFAQVNSNMRGSSIATQFALQISESFVKRYIESIESLIGVMSVIKDTPSITFNIKEANEVTTEETKIEEVKPQELSSVIFNENALVLQNRNKTYIKGKTNEYDEYVINTEELDDVLLNTESAISSFYVQEMQRYLTNPKTIEKLVEKPNDIINKQTLTREEQDRFKQSLNGILYVSVGSFLQEEVNRLSKAYAIDGKTFKQGMGIDENIFIEKTRRTLMKSQEIKDYTESQLANFSNELDNTLIKQRQFVASTLTTDKAQGYSSLTRDLADVKGVNFEKLAPLGTLTLMHIVNQAFISKTKKDFTLVRSGVLEHQCRNCEPFMGATYEWDGNKWVGDLPYKNLPDPDCLGKDNCRCFYVQVPLKQIEAMNKIRADGL